MHHPFYTWCLSLWFTFFLLGVSFLLDLVLWSSFQKWWAARQICCCYFWRPRSYRHSQVATVSIPMHLCFQFGCLCSQIVSRLWIDARVPCHSITEKSQLASWICNFQGTVFSKKANHRSLRSLLSRAPWIRVRWEKRHEIVWPLCWFFWRVLFPLSSTFGLLVPVSLVMFPFCVNFSSSFWLPDVRRNNLGTHRFYERCDDVFPGKAPTWVLFVGGWNGRKGRGRCWGGRSLFVLYTCIYILSVENRGHDGAK